MSSLVPTTSHRKLYSTRLPSLFPFLLTTLPPILFSCLLFLHFFSFPISSFVTSSPQKIVLHSLPFTLPLFLNYPAPYTLLFSLFLPPFPFLYILPRPPLLPIPNILLLSLLLPPLPLLSSLASSSSPPPLCLYPPSSSISSPQVTENCTKKTFTFLAFLLFLVA